MYVLIISQFLFLHLTSHVKTGTVSTVSTIHMHAASIRELNDPPHLQLHVVTFKELAGGRTTASPLINVTEDSNEHYMVSLSFPSSVFLMVLKKGALVVILEDE